MHQVRLGRRQRLHEGRGVRARLWRRLLFRRDAHVPRVPRIVQAVLRAACERVHQLSDGLVRDARHVPIVHQAATRQGRVRLDVPSRPLRRVVEGWLPRLQAVQSRV